MSTPFLFILAMPGLMVGGLLPVPWIAAVVLLAVGPIHMWQVARESARQAWEE